MLLRIFFGGESQRNGRDAWFRKCVISWKYANLGSLPLKPLTAEWSVMRKIWRGRGILQPKKNRILFFMFSIVLVCIFVFWRAKRLSGFRCNQEELKKLKERRNRSKKNTKACYTEIKTSVMTTAPVPIIETPSHSSRVVNCTMQKKTNSITNRAQIDEICLLLHDLSKCSLKTFTEVFPGQISPTS